MKRNVSGILAVILAISFSAFSTKRSVVYFEYYPPGGSYANSNVENEANWYRTTFPPCFSDWTEKACTIGIDASYLELTVGFTLASSDTNNDLSVEADFLNPAAVIDVTQYGVSSIDPEIYNDIE